MRTISCSFTWPDGEHAKAVLAVRAPENFYPVKYSGAADRLVKVERASAAGIEPWAAEAAAAAGAELSIRRLGLFDWWAK
jgi:hypothetical protein